MSVLPLAGAQEMEYFYDGLEQHDIYTVALQKFTAFQEKINKGQQTGVYWIKIPVEKGKECITIRSNHITSTTAFNNQGEISLIKSDRFPIYDLGAPGQIAFIKVLAEKEAFIPIETTSSETVVHHEQRHGTFNGIFYGFAFMVVILNLFLYFNFRDTTFLLYVFMLACIILVFSYRDGFIEFLGVPSSFKQYTEPFLHSIGGVAVTLFAVKYLSLRLYYPRFVVSLMVVCALMFAFDIMYVLTNDYTYFLVSDTIEYYVFLGCWVSSLLLFRRHSYAAIFCLAYFLMTIMAYDFFLAPAYGIPSINITPAQFKISGYIEMLIITYAVIYRMRAIQDEYEFMRSSMDRYLNEIDKLSTKIERMKKTEDRQFEDVPLSQRESDVLNLIAQGKTNKQIADALHISVNTVKYHVKNLYEKLNISSRQEARHLALDTYG
jgi:DNA-binding CsgD family transcriptional regulator